MHQGLRSGSREQLNIAALWQVGGRIDMQISRFTHRYLGKRAAPLAYLDVVRCQEGPGVASPLQRRGWGTFSGGRDIGPVGGVEVQRGLCRKQHSMALSISESPWWISSGGRVGSHSGMDCGRYERGLS